MTDRFVFSRVVTLAKPTTEVVSQARIEVHQWLAGALANEPVRYLPLFERTVYVRADELLDDDKAVSRWVEHSRIDRASGPTTLVLDFTLNSYDLIRDPLAHDAADLVVRWLKNDETRSAVIVLPILPAKNASIFWLPLKDASTSPRITVIASDGKAWMAGRYLTDWPVGTELSERLAALVHHERAELFQGRDTGLTRDSGLPILRELGHFPVRNGKDEPFCASYFFDADLAIQDLGRMLVNKIAALDLQEQVVLLSHGARSQWLRRVTLWAGGRLPSNAPAYDITGVKDVNGILLPGQLAILVFDVVNSGGTCEAVVKGLIDQNVPLADVVFTVMRDRKSDEVELPSGMTLEGLLPVDSEKVPQEECIQCKMELPYTEPLSQDYRCRPYDFWKVLFKPEWQRETYGPKSARMFPEAPDMGASFEEFGDWIAFKVSRALVPRQRDLDKEVVLVCPKKPM